MTIDELGKKTKQKYPEYSAYSDREIGERVLVKYPEYNSYISKPGLVQSIAQGMVSPFAKTASTALSAGKGVVNLARAAAMPGKITENPEAMKLVNKAQEPVNVNLGYFGEHKPVENVREAVGTGMELGAWAMGVKGGKYFRTGKLIPRMKKSAMLGATFGLSQGLQEKETTPKDIAERTLISGAIGAALPVFGQAVRGTSKYLFSRGNKALGILTGESEETIANALKNPKMADMGASQGDDALRSVVKKGADNSVKLRSSYIEGYANAKKILIGNEKTNIDKNKIINGFKSILSEKNAKVLRRGINYKISPIRANPGEISKINDAYDIVRSWKDFSPSGVDDLKQIIGQLSKFPMESGGTSKSPTLGKFYYFLNNTIKKSLPEPTRGDYSAMNKVFSENLDLYDDMVKAFNSGDPFTKIAGTLGKNRDSLRMLMDFYEKQTGESVVPVVAGRELAMEKTAAFGFLNPRSWVDFFLSPKIQAKIVTGAGKVGNKVSVPAKRIFKTVGETKIPELTRIGIFKTPKAIERMQGY
jgi:hypothetical protein